MLCTVAAKAQTVPTAAEDSVRMFRLQEVEVTATRATTTTPVAYANLSHETIARNSYGYDIPSVLALTPSMIATNETGIGIGGTSMRLRGTDATRLNVTVNGVPLNNPDSHAMYWYDTPDLISAVGTMQIQRGAGISTNGTGRIRRGHQHDDRTAFDRIPRHGIALLRLLQHEQASRRDFVGPLGRALDAGRPADAHRLGRIHRPRRDRSEILSVPNRDTTRATRC